MDYSLENMVVLCSALHGCVTDSFSTAVSGSDYGSLSEPMWRFLQGSYGGGPEVPLQQAQPVVQAAVRPTYPTRPPPRLP